MEEKTCSVCGLMKPIGSFRLLEGTWRARSCKLCSFRAQSERKAKRLASGEATVPAEKRCGKCRNIKASCDFSRATRTHDGLQGYCRRCVADARFEKVSRGKRHGLTEDEWRRMMVDQDMSCAICRSRFSDLRLIATDHDHKCCASSRSCGQCVRGLLCHTCNSLLGFAKDSTATLRHAITYLEKSP